MLRDHVLNVIMHLELDIQSEQTAADMSITGNISKKNQHEHTFSQYIYQNTSESACIKQ